MAEEPRDLRAAERATESVVAVRQIVQAVWTLARAQQPRVEAAVGEAAGYLEWVHGLVARFRGESHRASSGRTLWVVVGPERPFCGGLSRRILEQLPAEGPLVLMGRRLADSVPASEGLEARIISSLPGPVDPDEIDSCARRVARVLLEIDHPGPVGIMHPTAGGSELHRLVLLAAGALARSQTPETYTPVDEVLAVALHEAVSGALVVGLAEGLRTEVRARLVAAEAARQGCDRRLEELRQRSRVLRQEAITGELLELYSGRLAELG